MAIVCLRYYTSPKSYTDLISLYTSLLAEKKTEYGEARDRLLNGLNKLQETNAVVGAMQAQLNQLQPVLEEKAQVRIVLLLSLAASYDKSLLSAHCSLL